MDTSILYLSFNCFNLFIVAAPQSGQFVVIAFEISQMSNRYKRDKMGEPCFVVFEYSTYFASSAIIFCNNTTTILFDV